MVNFPQVYASAIIAGCDGIERQHNKLLSACNFIQSEIEDLRLRTEIRILSDFIRDLPPKFSAGGFFEINRNIISAFLSALVSYLIIIIQFKISVTV